MPLAVLFGGSGFVGRYITQELAKRDWQVLVMSRNKFAPSSAALSVYGEPGQVAVETLSNFNVGNVTKLLSRADAVVNCIGSLYDDEKDDFSSVHVEIPGVISQSLAECSSKARFVHFSTLGTSYIGKSGSVDGSDDSDPVEPIAISKYIRSKHFGEKCVSSNYPDTIIFRPSVIFGNEDDFFNKIAKIACVSPVIPVVGPKMMLQPIYVGDVARIVADTLEKNNSEKKIQELGGPDVISMLDCVRFTLSVIKKRRMAVNIPPTIARLMAMALDFLSLVTFSQIPNHLITSDQIAMMESKRQIFTIDGDEELKQDLKSIYTAVPKYLGKYRKQGEFDFHVNQNEIANILKQSEETEKN